MAHDIAMLVYLYWQMERREGNRLPLLVRLAAAVAALVVAAFSAFMGFSAGLLAIDSGTPISLPLATAPGVLITALIAFLLFTGFNQALQALYLNGDTERLLIAPLRPATVVTAKLLARLPSLVQVIFILVVPALLTYGVAIRTGPLYYFASVLVVLGAPLFGLSVGAIVSMLLVRFIPARRLSEHIGAAYIVIGMLIAVGIRVPFFLGEQRRSRIQPESIEAVQSLLASAEQTPLPTFWAGSGLVELGQGHLLLGFRQLAVYLLLTFGLFALTIVFSSRLYLASWLRMQASGMKKEGFGAEPGILSRRSLESALAVKDWLLRLRDSRQVASLFAQLIAAVFILFLLARPGDQGTILSMTRGTEIPDDAWWLLAFLSPGVVVSGMVLLLGWTVFFQAARVSLALEQRSFYLLKAAPITARQVLRGKVLGTLVPYSILMTLTLMGSWYFVRFSITWIPYAWLCLLIIGGGMLAFGTAMGFPWVNLDWEDPRRMGSPRGNLYSSMGAILLGIIGCAVAVLGFGLSLWIPEASLLFSTLAIVMLAVISALALTWANRVVEDAWSALGNAGNRLGTRSVPSWRRRLGLQR